MDKFKKLFKKWDIGLLFGIGLIILGVILILLPGSSLTTVCTVLGIGVGIKGAIKLFGYLKAKKIESENSKDLISAIFILLGAFTLIMHPRKLISFIPFVIGVGILIYGITSFFKAKSLFSKVVGVITAVIGLGIIGSPFALAEIITSVLGVALVIVGIIVAINAKNTVTLKIEGNGDDGYTEVDFTDV